MYDDILVATDGSDPADLAVSEALDLAESLGATLHVLYVADTSRDSLTMIGNQVEDVLVEEGERVVDDVEDRARERGVSTETVIKQGRPADIVVDHAEAAGIDAIVMGTHGRSGATRVMLGSVTERVVRTTDIPVLVVGSGD